MITDRVARQRDCRVRRLVFGGLAVLLLLATRLGAATAAAPTEYQVKAAFLFNFAKFVTWSPGAFPSADSPIRIGILGHDPFNGDLSQLVAAQKVQGRSFEIVAGDDVADVIGCHIVFIGNGESARQAADLAALRRAGSPALTVGEDAGFLDAGGVIQFVVERNKVRFEINLAGANDAGIILSSKLLSLARHVRGGG